jgi:hypothetical protein
MEATTMSATVPHPVVVVMDAMAPSATSRRTIIQPVLR